MSHKKKDRDKGIEIVIGKAFKENGIGGESGKRKRREK